MPHVFMCSWCHFRNKSPPFSWDIRCRNWKLLPARTLSYVPLIKHCTSQLLLDDGKITHASFVENGRHHDTLVMNLLIQMYSKCHALDDAHATFEGMVEERNVFSWTIMIGAYAEHQHYKEALSLFKKMEPLGVTPNRVTFITVASACASMADLDEGKFLHFCIGNSPCMSDVTVGNSLVSMYDKCGSIHDAYLVFGKMSERNSITWNSIVAAFAHHGQHTGALQHFHQMQQEDVIPDKVSFLNVLSVDANYTDLVDCKRMHARIVMHVLEPDVVLGTAIVCMYAKHGNVDYAWIMFNHMTTQNIISWNAILAAFEEHGREKEVLQFFQQMQLEGLVPDKVTYVTVLTTCATSQQNLLEAKRLHSCMLCNGLNWDLILWNALINMYGAAGSLEEALRLFEETPVKDVVSWNAVIMALTQCECGQLSIQFFQQMQLECVMPNKVTLVSIVDACASEVTIGEGRRVHAQITGCGFRGEVAESNVLLNMYGKCGRVENARNLFDNMEKRDVISWSAMAAAYAQHGYGSEALQLFDQMQVEGILPNKVTYVSILDACARETALAEGKLMHAHIHVEKVDSDLVIGNALVNMYSKCHNFKMARTVFDGMLKRDVVSWTTMISAYAQEGYQDVALQLFYRMQGHGVRPNKVTFISILDAFANQAALLEGQTIYSFIVRNDIEVDLEVGNAVISLYGKCGCLEDAQRIFDRMPRRNVISWSTMISSYSQYGMGKKAYKLYREMQKADVVPNQVTFLSVLTACSHAGLLDEGCRCFATMCYQHSIAPTLEHYNCMVDLFSRAGKIEEGIDVIHKMPMGPVATTWMTVLGACRMHLNLEQAVYAAEKIFEIDPENATPYVLLSNIFAEAGRHEDAVHIKTMMLNKGLKIPLGCSSITVNGEVHNFYAGDVTHPHINSIHIELNRLYKQNQEEGYVGRENFTLHEEEEDDDEEEVKGGVPYYHSEELAIAFGLISTAPNSPLYVKKKNLRVCDECHSVIKYISKVTKRQIVVRDDFSSHCFKDGTCTCSEDQYCSFEGI